MQYEVKGMKKMLPSMKVTFITKHKKCATDFQLGSVAGPVIQATGRLESEDGLRTGVLLHMGSR